MLNQINISNSNVQNEHIPTNNTTITKEPSETTVTINNNLKTTAFKEGVGNFHTCVLVNCSDIKKNRTVSIFTHNMKEKAVWSNFKQVFKNIGRNIGVLARTIATFGKNKTIALKAERELAENLGTMKEMMNCLDKGNFKDFFNFLCEKDCADYLSDLRNCEKKLGTLGMSDTQLMQQCMEHLVQIRKRSDEMRNFIIEHTDIEPLKQLMDETAKLLETGTKETYEQALQNLDKIKEHENFIKGYNALITDANKDCLPDNAKPLLLCNRDKYHKIIEEIKTIQSTAYLKDLHYPSDLLGSKYEDPIEDALRNFLSKAYESQRNLLKAHTLMENGTLPANGENKGKPTDIGGINGFSVFDLKIDDPDFVDKYQKIGIILSEARNRLGSAISSEISDTGDHDEALDEMEETLQDLRMQYQLQYHIDPETGKSTIQGE